MYDMYDDSVYAPRQRQMVGAFPSDVRSDGGAAQGALLNMQNDPGPGVEASSQYQEMLAMLAAEAAKQKQKQGGGANISSLFGSGGASGGFSGGGGGGGF